MNRRIFTGTDPGSKGACAVLAVADCPADEAQHGRVLAVEVFDLPVVARDNGGHDLDVVTFKVALRTALVNVAGPTGGATGCDGLVEYPVLTAGFGGGIRSKVQQGVNAGAVWAAMKATGLVQVAWVDSDKWRTEVNSQKGCEFIEAATVLADVMPSPEVMAGLRASADQCVAVLLAEVARRRWLGTATVPKTTGTARAAKDRKADRRREAIARAVAPLTVAKAKMLAISEAPGCEHSDSEHGHNGANSDTWCTPRNKCCEARLLDWAWRQKSDLIGVAQGLALHAAVKDITTPGWHMCRRTARSKVWTVETNGWGATTIPNDVGDLLIDHGLVQMDPGLKDVVYRPTRRGIEWSMKVRAAQQ